MIQSLFSNRIKVFATIGVIFVVSSLLLYTAATYLIQSQFSRLEIADAEKNTARAVDALNNRVGQIAVKNTDWSNWDDTYEFIVNRNEQLVFAKAVDSEGEDMVVPPELLKQFGAGSLLFTHAENELRSGFVGQLDFPVLFAARPILTSDASGPVRGTVVFGEYFTAAEAKNLAQLTHLDLHYYPLADKLPADVEEVRDSLQAKTAYVRVLDRDTIAGYQLVNDVFGSPLIVAKVDLARDAFLEAGRSLRYFLIVISLVTLLSILLAFHTTKQIAAGDQFP